MEEQLNNVLYSELSPPIEMLAGHFDLREKRGNLRAKREIGERRVEI
jgi:hypothetical protein